MNTDQQILSAIAQIFPNIAPENVDIISLQGGRNNRAYRAKINGEDYFLKHYNKSVDANRSRLDAEYSFLSYASACGCQYVTRPISCDEPHSIGIYEYISGVRFQKDEVGEKEISEAMQFIADINKCRSSHQADKLSIASEACFSINEHLARVHARVEKLNSIELVDDIYQAAANFVKTQLLPAWIRIKENLHSEAIEDNVCLDKPLTQNERIISPSDFGFHNALKLDNNKIKFVDFEYSGWDDPAKLIGDFFNQIEIPVSLIYFNAFTKKLSELVENNEKMIARAKLLLPVYRIKWVCIVLNYFLPDNTHGKDFVSRVTDVHRIEQLNKAKSTLNSLNQLDQLRG